MKARTLIGVLALSLSFTVPGPAIGPSTHAAAGLEKATFAGGCFWSMTIPFEGLEGVVSVTAGYTGGHTKNPTYEEVETGTTGHAESVEILYDPSKIAYARLLDVFWHNIDPTVGNGQFCDFGDQYRTAIFYHDEEQRRLAEESKKAIERPQVAGHGGGAETRPRGLPGPIHTRIVPAGEFYKAEEYHQDFHKKNPGRYAAYRQACGRDRRLKEIWGSAAGKH